MSPKPLPTLYLTHGGGALPLLGHKPHVSLVSWLKQFSSHVSRPRAILLISAHWEEHVVNVSNAAHPEMIFDYYGFPPEAYSITYPVPGDPQLAMEVANLLGQAGIKHQSQPRGLDHAAFVPLKLLYPAADIPVVTLSLLSSLDAQAHVEIGKALAPLRQQGVLIIGSGASYHNLREWLGGAMDPVHPHRSAELSKAFNADLVAALTNKKDSPEERQQKLVQWEQLAEARRCHPREEHLLPLMVAFGAGGCAPAEVIFDGFIGQLKVSSFQFN